LRFGQSRILNHCNKSEIVFLHLNLKKVHQLKKYFLTGKWWRQVVLCVVNKRWIQKTPYWPPWCGPDRWSRDWLGIIHWWSVCRFHFTPHHHGLCQKPDIILKKSSLPKETWGQNCSQTQEIFMSICQPMWQSRGYENHMRRSLQIFRYYYETHNQSSSSDLYHIHSI